MPARCVSVLKFLISDSGKFVLLVFGFFFFLLYFEDRFFLLSADIL